MIRSPMPSDLLSIGHVYCAAWKAAYKGIVPDDFLGGLTDESCAPRSHRPDSALVCEENGKIIGVAAFGANALKLHPEILVCDGRMDVGKKYRGDIEKSVTAYIRGRLEGRDDVDPGRLFITHSGVPAELLDKAKALAAELQPFREILITQAGCTISSHCGPACFGVLFFKK